MLEKSVAPSGLRRCGCVATPGRLEALQPAYLMQYPYSETTRFAANRASPTLHAQSGQVRSRRSGAGKLPSLGDGRSSGGRTLQSAAGFRRRSPSRSGDFGSPLGQPLAGNPLLSVALALDGVAAARFLIELRHDQAPHATAALRRFAQSYCGGTLVLAENHLQLSLGATTDDVPSDSATSAGLGHWGRGVVSLAPDGGLVLLLGPCELPGHRAVGQLVKGYVGLSYVEAAAKLGSDLGQPADLMLVEANIIRGLPGEAVPAPTRWQASTVPRPASAAVKPAGSKAAKQPLKLLHFNDVYEVEARKREPVGGVSRFIAKLKR